MNLHDKKYVAQSVHTCLLGTHSEPRTEDLAVKHPQALQGPCLRAAEGGSCGSGTS